VKLERWALIAEVVSGVAVVVTLVFLVLGLQANTNATRAAVYGDLVDSINEIQLRAVDNPELIALQLAMFSGRIDDLDSLERQRLGILMTAIYRNYEKAYYSNRYGVIGGSEWDRFQSAMCGVYGRIQGTELVNLGISAEFRDFLAQECSD
jgi:hypothetical protein